jgi:hypothetical protein
MVILLSKRQKWLGFEVRKLKLPIRLDEAGHCSCARYRFQEVVPLNAINVLRKMKLLKRCGRI